MGKILPGRLIKRIKERIKEEKEEEIKKKEKRLEPETREEKEENQMDKLVCDEKSDHYDLQTILEIDRHRPDRIIFMG